jgi:hypothetical protein
MQNSTVFTRLIEDYGSHEKVKAQLARRNTRKATLQPVEMKQIEKVKLIQDEERVTGSVAWVTYLKYFRYAGSKFWVPTITFLVMLSQIAVGKLTQGGLVMEMLVTYMLLQLVTIFSLVSGQVLVFQGSPKPTTWLCMQLLDWRSRSWPTCSAMPWRMSNSEMSTVCHSFSVFS